MKLGNEDIERLPHTKAAMNEINKLYDERMGNNYATINSKCKLDESGQYRAHGLWRSGGYSGVSLRPELWISSIKEFGLLTAEIIQELTPFILSGEDNGA